MSIGTTRPAAQLGTEISGNFGCDWHGDVARPEFSKIHFVPFQDTLPAASGAQSSSEMLRDAQSIQALASAILGTFLCACRTVGFSNELLLFLLLISYYFSFSSQV